MAAACWSWNAKNSRAITSASRCCPLPFIPCNGLAFVKKYSVQFVSPNGKVSQPFYFFNRYDRETVAQTWQVLRSEFDSMLLENARGKGATVLEEVTVKDLIKEQEQVKG